MNHSNRIVAAISGLLGAGALALAASPVVAADKPAMEKCYGLAKAGKNDCAAGAHSCSGQSTTDAGAKEWVYLPKGTCERLVGGSLAARK